MKKFIVSLLFIVICFAVRAQIRIVFRCDDFRLVNDTIQQDIIKTFHDNSVPLTIGVIPADRQSKIVFNIDSLTLSILRKYVNDGSLEIALHGFSHTNTNPKYYIDNEFEGIDKEDQARRIILGKELLDSVFSPMVVTTFIPPRNVYNSATIAALSKYGFKVISANRGGIVDNRMTFYPCTTEDFDDISAFVKSKEISQINAGTMIVLFHPYTFSLNRFTIRKLDSLLKTLSNDSRYSFSTLKRLYSDSVPSYNGSLRHKNISLCKMLFRDKLLFLNSPSSFVVNLENSVLYLIIGLLFLLPFLLFSRIYSREKILSASCYSIVILILSFLSFAGPLRLLLIVIALSIIVGSIIVSPTLRRFIKQIIICLRYIFYRYFKQRAFSNFKVNHSLTIYKVFPFKQSLFGYYNLSPENVNHQIIGCDISSGSPYPICIKEHQYVIEIGKTESLNYQQGCMAQWDFTNFDYLYYNRFNKQSQYYEAVHYDARNNLIMDIFPMPFYSISRDGKYALSLNFERLAVMRPDYGYFCRKNVILPDDDHDGIWKIDLSTKESILLITLKQLKELNPVPSMVGAKHKVNHIDISPNGDRFMFLHRWVGPQGRFMRLITANRDGRDIDILNGDIMTSHSCWYNNDQIISFCYTEKFKNSYVLFNDKSTFKELVSSRLPHFDGHPSVSPNGEWLITDCYPDLSRMSKIFLYNFKHDEIQVLGRFYQPLRYSGVNRIDLHPKWNLQGDKIYFESGHDGFRKLYYIDVKSIVC